MISVSGGLDAWQRLSSLNHMAALLFPGWVDSFSPQPCTKQATFERKTSPVSQWWVTFMYYWFFCSCSQPSVNLMSLKEFMEFCIHFVNMKCNFYIVLLSARKWNSFIGFDTVFLNITTKSIPTYSIIYTLKHFFLICLYTVMAKKNFTLCFTHREKDTNTSRDEQ